ncbi:LysR family transcriptional regulator [Pantoea cypripedii]|uniref:LysR family transcriptional regulator n=1 Tax=Pantoea cypripedii TaxID=55209 RepID=A0A6B9G735_PANCY|nr:LysR family transcriptional regulator [Pantoea cypripedii]QGY32928.1 LysR family transcriptional regulator [Pantoea cypripedii]
MGFLNLLDVANLVAVVDAGGFRMAAQVRGISSSTLSDSIRRLESDIGVRLLNRTTRSISLTEAGIRLLSRLKPALTEIEAAFNELQDGADRPVGTLRLNVPVPVARYVLPDLLPDFIERFPGVRIDVVMEDDFSDVIGRGFDAGVRYGENIELDMIAIPIGPRHQRFVAAASSNYLDKFGIPDNPSDLARHRLIGHRFPNGSIWTWALEREGVRVKVAPDGFLISSSVDLQLASAAAGAGIIYTFEDFVAPYLKSGMLTPVLETWWQEFDGPFLYYHGRRQMPPPLRAFVDFLKEKNAGRSDPPALP